MCCFSAPVDSVSDTSIFARLDSTGTQHLVYQMHLSSRVDVAMVLPLPTRSEDGEGAVQFVNLEDYPHFFRDMRRAFPEPRTLSAPKFAIGAEAGSLQVHQVGNYESSFVPSIADFDRLDERFRIPAETWESIPGYEDFGFAVFKLREGDMEVHPMAFRFRTALSGHTFFPTVHIHDGDVHEKADFDHQLFLQGGEPADTTSMGLLKNVERRWEESVQVAGQVVEIGKTQGMVEGDAHLYRLRLRGKFRNRDVAVSTAAA